MSDTITEVKKLTPFEFALMIDQMAGSCGTSPQAILKVYATRRTPGGLEVDRVKYVQDLSYYDEGKLTEAARQVQLDKIKPGESVIQFKSAELLLSGKVLEVQRRGPKTYYRVTFDDPYSDWPRPRFMEVAAQNVLSIQENADDKTTPL